MEFAYYFSTGCFVAFGAWQDIRRKSVDVRFLIGFGMVFLILSLCSPTPSVFGQTLYWSARCFGALFGVGVCAVSRWSQGAIGMGDALFFTVCGYHLGVWILFYWLLLCGCLLFPCALFLVVVKKWGKKRTLPFLPFLLAGYLALCVLYAGTAIP